jgi:hypothetical protein
MEPGTSSFDDFLTALGAEVRDEAPPAAMETVSAKTREAFGVILWFAEIFGPRWSYVAGLQETATPTGKLHKIPIAPGLGLVVAGFGTMPALQQEAFLEWVKKEAARWISR